MKLCHSYIASIILLILITIVRPNAQIGCHETYAKALGSLIDNERGYSLAVSNQEPVIYLGGLKNDSVVILKILISGVIEWTRTFDFIPGRADYLHGFMVDSEGMIVGSGGVDSPQQGTTVFAFRYNPGNNSMLWANDYSSVFNNLANSIQEIVPGGDYLMSNNPHTTTPNDLELLKLNRITGDIIPLFSKHYGLGGSESLGDISHHNGFLYAAGRFTDGLPNSKMRNTLIKLDPVSGLPEWTILGHKPQNESARLYGVDLVIDQDAIYSISLGDPDGTDINTTEIFVQKTTLDGMVIWLNQYDLPGSNDWVDEIIYSDNGFVVLARNRVPPSDMILFKVDRNGGLQWARKFDFSDNDNSVFLGGVQSQLLAYDDHIYFTAYAQSSGSEDMILVKTNLQGEISDTCFETSPVSINVIPVLNPVFYNVQPSVVTLIPEVTSLSLASGTTSSIITTEICNSQEVISEEIEISICEGEVYEGYTVTGIYTDQFTTAKGCDSLRILNLTVSDILFSQTDVEICSGESYEGYHQSGMYTDTLEAAFGCDSVRVLNLTVLLFYLLNLMRKFVRGTAMKDIPLRACTRINLLLPRVVIVHGY